MKLLCGPTSPFVRKVLVTLHELGRANSVELVTCAVSATAANPDVVAHNPIGKIPTLLLDDGSSLYDSTVICEYLAEQAGDRRLFPDAPRRWRALRLNALADGLIIAGVLVRNEAGRPADKRFEPIAQAQLTKVHNCVARLGVEAPTLERDAPTIGELAVAGALGWLDVRMTEMNWRDGRPELAAWYECVAQRPSLQHTLPRVA
jgi:glutathione S-transferase